MPSAALHSYFWAGTPVTPPSIGYRMLMGVGRVIFFLITDMFIRSIL